MKWDLIMKKYWFRADFLANLTAGLELS